MKSCKSCGCVNDNINRYCRNCGTSFENTEEPVIAPAAEDVPATLTLPEEEKRDFFDFGPVAPTVLDLSTGEGVVLFDTVTEEVGPEPDYIDFDTEDEAPEEAEEVQPTPQERLAAATRSPLYLIFAILASLGLALTLLRVVLALIGQESVVGMGTPFSDLVDMLFIAGFDRVSAYTAALVGAPVYRLLQLFALAPAILYAIGVWLFFGGVKRKGTAGLNLILSGNIVSLSGYGLSFAACGAVALSLLITLLYAPGDTAASLVGLLLLTGVMGAVSLLGVLYGAFAILSVNRVRVLFKKGTADHRLSVFVMVMNLLIALAISSVSGFYLAGGDLISFALSVVNMFTYVFLTMVMVRYRLELK